jgi:uncharacterized protein
MKIFPFLLIVIIISIGFAGCGGGKPAPPSPEYKAKIEQWQQKRSSSVSSKTGWLTVSGLYWLRPGENTFGTDSSCAVILPPGKAPGNAGSIWWRPDSIFAIPIPGTGVRWHDSLISRVRMYTDTDTVHGPTVLTIGPVSFFIIQRGNQMGVRVKDQQNQARTSFSGLAFYPVTTEWTIPARYEKYPEPRIIPIASVIGTVTNDTFPGAVVFSKNGQTFRLEAQLEKGSEQPLYVMFSDETSGHETYGNGRQLSATMPDSAGAVTLDFNTAYNWPCAYTDFATCPVPPRENHLALRIEAGEKTYPGHSH